MNNALHKYIDEEQRLLLELKSLLMDAQSAIITEPVHIEVAKHRLAMVIRKLSARIEEQSQY